MLAESNSGAVLTLIAALGLVFSGAVAAVVSRTRQATRTSIANDRVFRSLVASLLPPIRMLAERMQVQREVFERDGHLIPLDPTGELHKGFYDFLEHADHLLVGNAVGITTPSKSS